MVCIWSSPYKSHIIPALNGVLDLSCVFIQLSSHQLFHVLCVVAVLLENHALSSVAEDRLRFGGCLARPPPSWWRHRYVCSPADAHCRHLVTAIMDPVPYRVKPSFVILLTSGHSDAELWASECPDVKKITNDGLTRYGTGCFIAVTRWQLWRQRVMFRL